MSAQDSQQNEEGFLTHLIELRDRVIKAGLSVLIAFLGLVYWAPEIFHLLAKPLIDVLPSDAHMIVTDVTGSFFVPIKVTFMVAFVVALPVVLYQLWAFVAPGLYQHEKKLILPLVVSTYTLFLLGMAFAYSLVFPTVFAFMVQYNAPLGAQMSTDIDKYLSFAMTTFITFGVTFEVPVVVVVLVKLGMVKLAKLKEIRPYIIVGAFIVAAVVTPPDILSQLLLAIPLCLLYELGLLLARLYQPKVDEDDLDEVSSEAN